MTEFQFKKELIAILEKNGSNFVSNTPCEVLADSMISALNSTNNVVNARINFYKNVSAGDCMSKPVVSND